MSIHRTALVLCCLTTAVAASPDAGDTERVSVGPAGAEASERSDHTALSADGRFVAFRSYADNLVAGDTNGRWDVFVYDRATGVTERVSVSSSGGQANAHSAEPDISADGRYVVFGSSASNLVSGDSNGADDVFLRDRQAGTTTRVSLDHLGSQLDQVSLNGAISPDGRYVAWSTTAQVIPGPIPAAFHVYLRDLATGAVTLLSRSTTGVYGDGPSSVPVISFDGAFAAYASVAENLVPGDDNGHQDVFVHELATGETTRVSLATSGAQGNSYSTDPSISADGLRVAFLSRATTLVAGDFNGTTDVFLRDRATGETTLLSVSTDGVHGDSWSYSPAISADGTRVAFYSWSDNLTPGATLWQDVYLRDLVAGTTAQVSVTSSGALGNHNSFNPDLSGDGRVVSFSSYATNLDPTDQNGLEDAYAHEYEAPPPAGPSAPQASFASSAGYVAIATVQPGGVTRAQSFGPAGPGMYAADLHAGLSPSGGRLSSASYEVTVAVAGIPAALTAPGPPLVFGAAPYVGAAAGGETIAVHGFNLGAAGGAAVELAGVPAPGVATTSNTVLAATSAPGTNPFGNPLGRGDVAVTTAAGAASLSDGFVYGPALSEDAPPRVGESYPLALHLDPGDLYQLALGTSLPGVAFPVAPLAGAAEIVTGIVLLTPLLPATADLVTLPLPIPDNPALVGLKVELQAAVITGLSPLAGTFTNRLETYVEP
jgi:Tol biopolymer transport system component